jgi:thiamine biosynthesis lipoprotein ApbE
MKRISIALVTSLFLLSSCQPSSTPVVYNVSNVFNIDNKPVNPFNTAIALTMFNNRDLNLIFPLFEAEIHRLHRLFDSYNYYNIDGRLLNNLSVINDNYGSGQAVTVDKDLIELIKQSVEMMKLTEGYFNPTLGILIDLWSPLFVPFQQELGVDPDPQLVASALECSATLNSIDQVIELNETNSTVRFNRIEGCDGKAKLALGAIAKGYAMERAKEIIGEYSYLIDGGRSSLITNGINPNPDRDSWNVVILTPYLGNNLAIAAVNNSNTFTTSGDYENSFIKDNLDGTFTVRHHILNPFTGYSENIYRSFTILSSQQAGLMDALGTALFNIKDLTVINRIVTNVETRYNLQAHILFQQEVLIDNQTKLNISIDRIFYESFIQTSISSLVNQTTVLD